MPSLSYSKRLSKILAERRQIGGPHVLDLFAGCGGLSLGFEANGFRVTGYEREEDACATYRRNLRGSCHHVELDPKFDFPPTTAIIAGPPCQPFSVIGNQRGRIDGRNGFDVFISAVQQTRPEIWMFENVRGLLFRSRTYFASILRKLRAFGYEVEYRLLNSKNFGVPQNRERVIVVGHQGGFTWPRESDEIVTAGEALGRMAKTAPQTARFVTQAMAAYIRRYEAASCCAVPRDLHLDLPARTLTCRNLAGATGDMHRIRLPDRRRRLLRPREAARLQSFPDWFNFAGSESSQLVQIGNAVSPLVAYHLAKQFRRYLIARGEAFG
jgi:DNA (cytosine-5)-methyltransferase 1